MIKKCAILNNKIINIGEWDSAIDEKGIEQNPMPEGATIEECDFEYDADRGWYEVGTLPEPTLEEKNRADIDYLGVMIGVDLI